MGEKPDYFESNDPSSGGENVSNSKPDTGPETEGTMPMQIDPVRFRMFKQQIKDNQTFSMGILAQ